MKTFFMLLSIAVLALAVFSITDYSSGLASAITGVNSSVKTCITKLEKKGVVLEKNQYNVTRKNIDTIGSKDILIKNISAESCGSAGCTHEICLVDANNVRPIAFGFAAEKIVIQNSITDQMYDIRIEAKSTALLEWSDSRYILK